MAVVFKKGGKRQAFSPGKLKKSVEKAAKDAKLSVQQRSKILKEVVMPLVAAVKKKRSIKASALRKAVLGRLERRSRAVSSAWKKFERKK